MILKRCVKVRSFLQSRPAAGTFIPTASSKGLLLTNANRSAVWRPITNHPSDASNPFVSISNQNKDYFYFKAAKRENI